MSESRGRMLAFVAACLLLGPLAGWLAGPALSRVNYVVRLAEDIRAEQSGRDSEPGLRAQAARIQGVPAEMIFAQANEIRARFRVGGALFGLWCGLVVGISFMRARRNRLPEIWEPDPAHCVACGRCYLACPLERERLNLHEQ